MTSININPKIIRGVFIAAGAYVTHRILKRVYRRGCNCEKKGSRKDGAIH